MVEREGVQVVGVRGDLMGREERSESMKRWDRSGVLYRKKRAVGGVEGSM